MINVMMVDETRLFREGLQAILSQEGDMNVVGLAANGEETIALVEESTPDVILMDIHMPELESIKTSTHIKSWYPVIKVIFLSTFSDEDLIITGMHTGADGFLLKNIDVDVLLQTIRNVYKEEIVFSGEVAQILVRKIRDVDFNKKEMLDRKLRARNIILTYRELEVACLLMEVKTNRHISSELHLNEGTIKHYISEIYNKLQIHQRAEVIHYLENLLQEEPFTT